MRTRIIECGQWKRRKTLKEIREWWKKIDEAAAKAPTVKALGLLKTSEGECCLDCGNYVYQCECKAKPTQEGRE